MVVIHGEVLRESILIFSVVSVMATAASTAAAATNNSKKGPKNRPRFEDGEAEVHPA